MKTLTDSYIFLLLHKHTDGTVRLQREVVLLTDDRNLRVKALTRNVPVRDIPAFLSWAKVGWTRLSWNQRSPTAEACLPLSQGEKTHLSRGRGDGRGEEMIKKAKNHFLWNTSKCSESRVVSLSFPPPRYEVCVCMYVLRSASFLRKSHGRHDKSQERLDWKGVGRWKWSDLIWKLSGPASSLCS